MMGHINYRTESVDESEEDINVTGFVWRRIDLVGLLPLLFS